MSTPDYEPQVVMVSRDAVPAHDCPTLIVLKDGVYYVSIAVWPFDLKDHPDLTKEQKRGYEIVTKAFEENSSDQAEVKAVLLQHSLGLSAAMSFGATRPGGG